MCNSLLLLHLQFNTCRYLPRDAMPSTSPKASPISLLLSTSRTPPSPPLFPTAINTGFFGYSRHVQGICDHVAKIMKHMHGLDFNPLTDIAVCCGQSVAFAATMFAIIDKGDEVILFDPSYETYEACISMAGGIPVYVPLDPPFWTLDADKLMKSFTTRTKAIDELETIAGACHTRDCLAITDEVYEHITYDNETHISLASLPGMQSRTIITSSLSKTYSVTGWRIGWAVAPACIASAIRNIHTKLTDSAPPPFQEATLIALRSPLEYFESLGSIMASKTSVQLISYSQEIVDGEPIYVSSDCLPIKACKFEPAGHSFHTAALRLSGFFEEEDADGGEQNVSNDKEQEYVPSSESYSTKGKKKSGAEGKQQDHYALLGLSHLSAKQAKKDEIENHFKTIQEAYEVLIDPARRRIYDSTDEFDDEIPTDCAPRDFFKVFGPAFMRHGRWSVNQPIPSLGDENTALKEVDSFYNFWYSFKSWREFPNEDEFDLEQAESRDHKRWMERQNAKLTEKARKEDYARIHALVVNAYKRDPRIQKREEEKAEKQRKKEAKYLAKKLQEEEAIRIAKEQRRQKEEEERCAAEAALHQKKTREKEKKLLRKERTHFRTLSGPVLSQHLLDVTKDDVESLCLSLEIEQLRNLCEKIEAKEGLEQAKLLREALGCNHNLEEDQKQDKTPKENGSVTVNGRRSLGAEKRLRC
ncbi:hypothetical protein ACSBR2_021418 [Camellia fascicularis]